MKFFKMMIIVVLPLIVATSCDFLDKTPDDSLTKEILFNDSNETREFLSNIYSFLPDGQADFHRTVGANYYSLISDEADRATGTGGGWASAINLGNWNASSNYLYNWEYYYQAIRSVHVFLNNVHPISDDLTQAEVDEMKLEARFLRAYYYYVLIRQYGPVPLILDQISPTASDEVIYPERTPFDEIIDWLDTELMEVANGLPPERSGNWAKQATKGMALAVRAKALLMSASPLFNGNTEYAEVTNPDGTPLFSTSYNNEKWKDAADAFKEVIDLAESTGIYSLYKEYDEQGNIDPFSSYQNLFLEEGNDEIIFDGPHYQIPTYDRFRLPRHANGVARVSVTQNLVDAYFMKNGLPINDSNSGYSEEGYSQEDTKYTESGTFNMYVDREPRFYASVEYSGMRLPQTGLLIDFTFDGRDGLGNNPTAPSTGYLWYKGLHPDVDRLNGRFPDIPNIRIRLAEIYLGYAEALNEYDGPDHPDIRKYLGLIRERAGLPVDNYFPAGLSKEEMRKRIRHERQVELALEYNAQRYFDIHRWKIAEDVNSGDFYGMDMSAETKDEFFQRTRFETRVFEKRFYLFPIPQNEMNKNSNLVQNPGW